MNMEQKMKDKRQPPLAEALHDLFNNVASLVQGELQGTNNHLELIEKMNLRTADEYNNFGDIASGLRVFVEQLKTKNESFHEYIQQIDEIDEQVTELEAIVSMLDNYTYTLESKVRSACGDLRPRRSEIHHG
eukprot:Gb_00916 [translate_table: standard]